jgi:hypothetical protein
MLHGSSSKRTRHINIRYFFVQDRVASEEVKIEYCPTGEMLADFFTQPLQGAAFKKFRDMIMNVDPEPSGSQDHRSVLKNEDEVLLGTIENSKKGNGATNARRSQMTRNELAMNHEGHVRSCFGTATRRTAQHTQPVTYWIISTVDTLTVR